MATTIFEKLPKTHNPHKSFKTRISFEEAAVGHSSFVT